MFPSLDCSKKAIWLEAKVAKQEWHGIGAGNIVSQFPSLDLKVRGQSCLIHSICFTKHSEVCMM